MKIAVLGSHPATKAIAPFRDKDWIIWACSPSNRAALPRVDAWFELHIPVFDPDVKDRTREYLDWLKSPDRGCDVIWMRDKAAMGEYPGAVLYPDEDMEKEFGPFCWTSSIAFMLAKAIKELEASTDEEKMLGIFGVMQASPNEYTYQRPAIQQFIVEAARRHIKIAVPPASKLFDVAQEKW